MTITTAPTTVTELAGESSAPATALSAPAASTPEEGPRAGRAARRTFTAEYQRSVVAEYDAAPAGDKGAVLRREGLYHSHVIEWRQKIQAGTLGKVTSRKPRAKKSPEQARIAELERELKKAEAESARKDKVIADREAALEVLGKGVSFLEALSKKDQQ